LKKSSSEGFSLSEAFFSLLLHFCIWCFSAYCRLSRATQQAEALYSYRVCNMTAFIGAFFDTVCYCVLSFV